MMIVALGIGIQGSVNALSLISDRRDVGRPIPSWVAWAEEATSACAWLLLLPLIWLAVARLRPPILGWAATAAAHWGMSLAVSLAHVGLMSLFRLGLWPLFGADYELSDAPLADFFYEYRKDFASYLILGGTCLALQWYFGARPAARQREAGFVVQDGARRHFVRLDDIVFAEAAGNYVELAVGDKRLLHRATLASLEALLTASDFVRVHRSRIVRRAAIESVETKQSGDFELLLRNGDRLKGSRRYRPGLIDPACA